MKHRASHCRYCRPLLVQNTNTPPSPPPPAHTAPPPPTATLSAKLAATPTPTPSVLSPRRRALLPARSARPQYRAVAALRLFSNSAATAPVRASAYPSAAASSPAPRESPPPACPSPSRR